MDKFLVSFSGGMDSATVLAEALRRSSIEVEAIGFTYGSKHNRWENEAAKKFCDFYHVRFRLLDISPIVGMFKSNLLQNGGPIPEGHYESASMSQTVVPGRNMIFASILTGIAWSEGFTAVYLGIHSGDHAIYPDCRPDFFDAMERAVWFGSDKKVQLMAPFLTWNKTTILQRGIPLGVPYHLTRTCYKDQPLACGKCGACQERLEAFHANHYRDPVQYEPGVNQPNYPLPKLEGTLED